MPSRERLRVLFRVPQTRLHGSTGVRAPLLQQQPVTRPAPCGRGQVVAPDEVREPVRSEPPEVRRPGMSRLADPDAAPTQAPAKSAADLEVA